MVIAGLVAMGGETVINNARYIDRGYEGIQEKLTALGADIRRSEEPELSEEVTDITRMSCQEA